MKMRVVALAVLATVPLTLVACGDDGGSKAAATDNSKSDSSTEEKSKSKGDLAAFCKALDDLSALPDSAANADIKAQLSEIKKSAPDDVKKEIDILVKTLDNAMKKGEFTDLEVTDLTDILQSDFTDAGNAVDIFSDQSC